MVYKDLYSLSMEECAHWSQACAFILSRYPLDDLIDAGIDPYKYMNFGADHQNNPKTPSKGF